MDFMKKIAGVWVGVFFLSAAGALAQEPAPSPVSNSLTGQSDAASALIDKLPLYDKSKEITLQGKITDVETASLMGVQDGVKVTLAGGGQTRTVILGPKSFLDPQGMSIKSGDMLTVRAGPTTMGKTVFWIASKISRDGKTIRTTDEFDQPIWKGWDSKKGAPAGVTPSAGTFPGQPVE